MRINVPSNLLKKQQKWQLGNISKFIGKNLQNTNNAEKFKSSYAYLCSSTSYHFLTRNKPRNDFIFSSYYALVNFQGNAWLVDVET